MLYSTLLKKMRKCPFCAPGQRSFAKNERAYLTYSLAPYAEYHLLVIPKRHAESFSDLNAAEARDVQAMIIAGVGVFHAKGIEDYTILVRNGKQSGKSVAHLHYHLVPNHRMGDLDSLQRSRKILTPKQIRSLTAEVAEILSEHAPRRRRGKR
jgi:diadenosine tetraphosphate (Ap4A) HIT family hydrolase